MAKIATVSDLTLDIDPNLAKNLNVYLVESYVLMGYDEIKLGDLRSDNFYHSLANLPNNEYP